MRFSMKKRGPQIIRLGSLNTIVRERGNNNDDGDGWSVLAKDERRPPVKLARGLRAFLFKR
jgi:hypothetical protein